MLVNRAMNLNRKPMPRPVRAGKTARDHANGDALRNAQNKARRADWQKDKSATDATFPG